METSLHQELKAWYGPGTGGRREVRLQGFRIDAVAGDGVLVEVQSGPLGPLRGKLARLLPGSAVKVVKPVVVARRVVRRATRDGANLSSRWSPRKGAMLDVFDDLIGLACLFPHANLEIEVLAVEIDEVRLPRRRWPGHVVGDRALRAVTGRTSLRTSVDLWGLLPVGLPDAPFTTRDLAEMLDRPLAFAQRVAYCLRLAGAVETTGKTGNRRIYRRDDAGAAARAAQAQGRA